MNDEPIVSVAVLGPLELRVGDDDVALSGTKLRAITALLALARGRVVSVDDLLDNVWGDDLPATARNTLQYHVGVLRKGLAAHGAAGALTTRDPGYALATRSDEAVFLARAVDAGRAVSAERHEQASALYAEALNQWRGPVLDDLRHLEFAQARAVSLEQQRLTCLESWADAELRCGRAEALVGPLQELVTENPTRERLWEHLMHALYRTGRQDAALSAFRTARLVLERELGVSPSTRLQEMHQRVLRQDAGLLAPSRPGGGRPSVVLRQTTLVRSMLAASPPTLVGPAGTRVVLAGVPVVIGRQDDCDLVLADDQASRRHARVEPVAGGYAIVDLGSTNGTAVNGVRAVGAVTLHDEDRIEVGSSMLRFLAR